MKNSSWTTGNSGSSVEASVTQSVAQRCRGMYAHPLIRWWLRAIALVPHHGRKTSCMKCGSRVRCHTLYEWDTSNICLPAEQAIPTGVCETMSPSSPPTFRANPVGLMPTRVLTLLALHNSFDRRPYLSSIFLLKILHTQTPFWSFKLSVNSR